MTGRKKKIEPTKGTFDSVIDLLTGRIAKITAFVATLGGLMLGILNYSGEIRDKLVKLHLYTPPQCVEVERLIVPETVKYSEWKKKKPEILIVAKKHCKGQPVGIYLSYEPATDSKSLFKFRTPYDGATDWEKCSKYDPGTAKCWQTWNPLDGTGPWTFRLPELEPLSARPIEPITVKLEIRDFNDPAKDPYWSRDYLINVLNDAN